MNTTNIVWSGVIRGAVLAGIVSGTASVLGIYVADTESGSRSALSLLVLIGLVLGGFAAGREASRYPYTNGGLASFLAFAAIEVAGIVLHVARGDAKELNPFSIVFLGILALTCGVVGGALGAAAYNRRAAKDQEGTT